MRELAHQSGAHGGLRELALFAGAGGGILGGHILGWRTVCAVEWDAYAIAVLCARQNEGVLPPFPIWDDIRTFRGHEWRGIVDVVSGGFPCTDISAAGKGAGIDGEASGLWSEMARIIGEVRPRYVFVENSPLLVSRGLARVLSDLAEMGYDARWGVVGARHAGAPHRRDRIWIVAESYRDGRIADYGRGTVPHGIGNGAGEVRGYFKQQGARGAGDVAAAEGERRRPGLRQDGQERDGAVVADGGADVPDADSLLRDRRAEVPQREPAGGAAAGGSGQDVPDAPSERGCSRDAERQDAEDARELRGSARDNAAGVGWWQSEPHLDLLADGMAVGVHGADATIKGGVGRVATGVPARVQRLKCIGNGQVPLCAAMAWQILTAPEGENKEQA